MKKIFRSKIARVITMALVTSALSTIFTSPSASAVTQNLTYDCFSMTPVTLYVNPDDLLTFTGSCGAVIAGPYNNILLSKLSFAFTGPQEFRVSATATPGTYTDAIDLFSASHTLYTVIVRGTDNAAAAEIAAAALAAQKAAEAKREAEKQAARAEITNSVKTSKVVNLEMFTKAEIYGVTAANIAAVQAEISALPQSSRADLSQVLKIARKYEVVGKIALDQFASVYSDDLIEIDLIPQGNKHKAALTAAIKKLPPSDRSTYTSIKKAIDAEMAEIQARKDRLANVIARNTSRYSK
jgi:hypothetical protein